MKRNPDDRSDNVERIQENIDNTIRNMELAEEIIEKIVRPQNEKRTVRKERAQTGCVERPEERDQGRGGREREQKGTLNASNRPGDAPAVFRAVVFLPATLWFIKKRRAFYGPSFTGDYR